MAGANSSEIDPSTPYPVIDLLPEQKDIEDLGGTMRLGLYPCKIVPGTLAAQAYGEELVYERHRHRYEFNNEYREQIETAGLRVSGTSPDGRLVEMIELPDHPWFLAVQFHPEFTAPIMRAYFDVMRSGLDAEGIDVQALRAGVAETPASHAILRRFFESTGTIPGAGKASAAAA